MTNVITAKNITKYESKEVISDNFTKILKLLHIHSRTGGMNFEEVEPGATVRQFYWIEGLVPQLSKEEYALHLPKNKMDKLNGEYGYYVDDYYNSLKDLKEVKEILKKHPTEAFYYRLCPISNEHFQVVTGKEIEERIRDFYTNSWRSGKRDFHGRVNFIESKSGREDDIGLNDRFHPDVVDEIKEQWNFTNPIVVDKDTEDGTPIDLNIESGKIQVAYNPHKSINHLSIQHLKLYPNTKGIHYRIRGSKRVYLDLVDIKL